MEVSHSIFPMFLKMDEAGAVAHLSESKEDPVVTDQMIAEIISEWSNIPVGKIQAAEQSQLLQLEQDMTVRVKGQRRAVTAVARAIRRSRSGLRDPNRPIASFLFCGPTGTGCVLCFCVVVGTVSRSSKLNLTVFPFVNLQKNRALQDLVRDLLWKREGYGPH